MSKGSRFSCVTSSTAVHKELAEIGTLAARFCAYIIKMAPEDLDELAIRAAIFHTFAESRTSLPAILDECERHFMEEWERIQRAGL